MSPCYPLSVLDERALETGYRGPVFVWDIDRTYLATRFSSLRHLARIPLEFAVDKQAIPGMPEVLRALRRGPGPRFAAAPIYFVTASPPELTQVVTRKMLLDGVQYDGITFKDWARTLRALRPGRLREQLGFKLCALLDGRLRRPSAREVLFGDDVEKDALAYSLYARLCAGTLAGGDAVAALTAEGVARDDRDCILALCDSLRTAHGPESATPAGRVERAFIYLDRGTPPDRFDELGSVIAPVRSPYQLALALEAAGHVDGRAVGQVTDAMRRSVRFRRADLEYEQRDAEDRGLLQPG